MTVCSVTGGQNGQSYNEIRWGTFAPFVPSWIVLIIVYTVIKCSVRSTLSLFYGFNSRHNMISNHDDVIKGKHFPRYWTFVRGIHRSPMNSIHKGQWREDLTFSLMYAWTNGWVDNRDAGDLRRHRSHYDVTVMMVLTNVTMTSLMSRPGRKNALKKLKIKLHKKSLAETGLFREKRSIQWPQTPWLLVSPCPR